MSAQTKNIQPINSDTVHKICSGQVVLNLAVAVKELVENSLDAGATNIEVRLKNYGIDLIEVSDNGSGVTEDNFSALTLKYYTSKLNDYSDLLGVTSFGFRGEALSSLCALANLTITTRHETSDYATKLEFDYKGNIVKKTLCSRQVGTTVTLTNLFSSLPVRQKEFHKNAKREFNKMTQLLYAYCLISLGVKITCSNQTNTKSVVVATQGSKSYKDNIVCVFGAKQLQTILELKPENITNIKNNILKGLSEEANDLEKSPKIDDVEIDLSEDSNDADEIKDSQTSSSSQLSTKSQGYKNIVDPVDFVGFVSSCAHGIGRSSTDRQFYFVNSRPCEPPKIMKLVNEIYRQYNPNQYPFVFLNVNINRSFVDINLTPDKRKVFLTKEKILLDVLKCSMLKLYESIPRTLKIENHASFNKNIVNDVKPDIDNPKIFTSFLQKFSNKLPQENIITSSYETKNELKRKSTTMLDFISKKSAKINDISEVDDLESDKVLDLHSAVKQQINNTSTESIEEIECVKVNINESDIIKPKSAINEEFTKTDDKIIENPDKTDSSFDSYNNQDNSKHRVEIPAFKKEPVDIMYLDSAYNMPDTQIRTIDDIVEKTHVACRNMSSKPYLSPAKKILKKESEKFVTDKADIGKSTRKTVTLKTSLDHVKALVNIYNNKKKSQTTDKVKFRTEINPVFNKKCEEELSKEISKESFKKMIVIGQFNLGFIITQLDEDLFIIDQHATDEIYNFETLQKTTELTNQKLVIPQKLELTGVNEQILMDNLGIFKKNGFTFEINENELPTKRVKLLTIPMSKNWIFGKDDIEELLFMLRESPSEHCRPSRVRAMFASRACRKSVMIGTALSKADMKKLVDHMAEIDQPWNCPHGRPTIRHLINMAVVHTKED